MAFAHLHLHTEYSLLDGACRINKLMDYLNETEVTVDIRWNDRITYDGTWENNLFNFFTKVTPKLTADLKKPFKLENNERIDDTQVH